MQCIERNGNITGYLVRYGIQENKAVQTSVIGGVSTEITISGLTFGANYSIAVAAVNSADIGKYSFPIIVTAQGTHSI